MNKIKKLFFIFIIGIGIIFTANAIVSDTYADAGNFRGSKSWSPGSSSSSHSSSSSRSHSGDSGSSFFLLYFLFQHPIIAIIIIILFVIYTLYRKKMSGIKGDEDYDEDESDYNYVQNSFINEVANLNELYNRDPNFSEPDLKERVSRIYVEMQEAWQSQKWEAMRAYLSPQLYSKLENQLNELKREGCINYIKRIAVLNVDIKGYKEDSKNQILEVFVETRSIDYTVDQNGNVVLGNDREEVFMGYKYELIRNIDAKTNKDIKDTKAMKCPNCGAPIDINSSGVCEFCGAVIQAKDYDWIVNDIEGIYQRM